MKMHLAGKTDQAKADLARLAIIRKQREEAAKKKEEEKKGKTKQLIRSLLLLLYSYFCVERFVYFEFPKLGKAT